MCVGGALYLHTHARARNRPHTYTHTHATTHITTLHHHHHHHCSLLHHCRFRQFRHDHPCIGGSVHDTMLPEDDAICAGLESFVISNGGTITGVK